VLRRDHALPFAAIVGHAEAKNALLLLAVDPLLGGVLLAAGVGSGKSSLIRSFRAVLPALWSNGGCPLHCDPNTPQCWCAECQARANPPAILAPVPFVEVPANVTDDRLLGGLDLEASLRGEVGRVAHGLIALANRGFLQVEHLNLLPKEVADPLLSALGQGTVGVEREGLSRRDPAGAPGRSPRPNRASAGATYRRPARRGGAAGGALPPRPPRPCGGLRRRDIAARGADPGGTPNPAAGDDR